MRRAVRLAVCLAAATGAGCTTEPALKNDPEIPDLVAAYRAHSAESDALRAAREAVAIRALSVDRRAPGRARVSVDLANAPLARVVGDILDRSGASYNLSDVRLSGFVTIRFSNLSLVDALNELTRSQGVSVARERGLLVFRYGTALDPAQLDQAPSSDDTDSADDGFTPSPAPDTVYHEVALRHLDVPEAIILMNSLFGPDDDDDSETGLRFGALNELNTIFVAGPAETVAGALAVLNRSDREVPHVLIEALVVDMDTIAATQLGARLQDLAAGGFSGVTVLPQLGFIGGTFTESAGNPFSLTASINLLISQGKAQVLSRPYIVSRSRRQATIEIVEEQFVAVEDSVSGASITSTDGITAGVNLAITPVVMADESIRIDLQLEESQFIPVGGDALVAKDRNTASSSVTVTSGQTIIIGGLRSKLFTGSNQGLPWLRRLPILDLLTAERASRQANKEVVLYLTPHVWMPGMDAPIVRPDLPSNQNSGLLTSYELPGEKQEF